MPSFTRFLISLSSSNSIILFKCFICLNIIGCKDQVRLIICAINIFKYIYNHFSFVNFLSVRGKNKLSKKSSLFEVCQIPRSVLIIINSELEFTPSHPTDVQFSLSSLLFGISDNNDMQCVFPGSLANSGLHQHLEMEELEALVIKQERDCLNLLHKNLVDKSPKQF